MVCSITCPSKSMPRVIWIWEPYGSSTASALNAILIPMVSSMPLSDSSPDMLIARVVSSVASILRLFTSSTAAFTFSTSSSLVMSTAFPSVYSVCAEPSPSEVSVDIVSPAPPAASVEAVSPAPPAVSVDAVSPASSTVSVPVVSAVSVISVLSVVVSAAAAQVPMVSVPASISAMIHFLLILLLLSRIGAPLPCHAGQTDLSVRITRCAIIIPYLLHKMQSFSKHIPLILFFCKSVK